MVEYESHYAVDLEIMVRSIQGAERCFLMMKRTALLNACSSRTR